MICFEFKNVGPAQEIFRYLRKKIKICNDRKVCISAKDFGTEKQTFNEIEELTKNLPIDCTYEVKYYDKGC